jgi:hypothetical protein
MRLHIFNAISGLLAIGLFSGLTQAHPYTSSDVAITIPPASIQANTSDYVSGIDTATTVRAKRTKPPLQFSLQRGGLESTWAGVVKEPLNSGWTKTTIKEYAYEGWQQTQNECSGVTIVAALWIRGKGVYLGSIPHAYSAVDKEHVETAFETALSSQAPLLDSKIGCRDVADKTVARYHAEDMAMLTYERTEKPSGSYPKRGYMAVYGQYPGGGRAAFLSPCGTYDADYAKINPSCATVLSGFEISS